MFAQKTIKKRQKRRSYRPLRLAIHESREGKQLKNTQVINFDNSFFAGKEVVVFDDVITQGRSYARFACAIEALGASVVGGLFLGRTIY